MKKHLTKISGKQAKTGKLISSFLDRNIYVIALIAFAAVAMSGTVFAGPPSADDLWNTVAGLIRTWVTRLGGVVMFVGGIMFGLGWKNDDAEGKSRGISTLIAGGIVTAVAALTSTFFA